MFFPDLLHSLLVLLPYLGQLGDLLHEPCVGEGHLKLLLLVQLGYDLGVTCRSIGLDLLYQGPDQLD